MKLMQLGLADGGCGPLQVFSTQSAWERMRGLLGRRPLNRGEALLISPCNMVHTVGMRYPIDVVFVDRAGVVLRICPAVPAGRARLCWRARSVVELAAHEAARRGWQVGQRLDFQPGAPA